MKNWQQRLLYMLVTMNVSVHFGDAPNWILFACLLLVSWRWLADLLRLNVPGRWVSTLFAVLGAVGLYLENGLVWSLTTASSLLLLLVSAKTMEIRGYRDIMMVTYLCLLLLMTKLLQSQSVLMTSYMLVDVFAILALLQLYHLPSVGHQWSLKRSLKMILGALPVVVVLFIFFPRFNLGLFRGQSEQASAQVGFSGTVRMGSGTPLARSRKVAFRAFFRSGYQPPTAKLYWRGSVLSLNSGLNWDPDESWLGQTTSFKAVTGENTVEVMNEEAGPRWLFTLEYPQRLNGLGGRPLELDEREGLSFQLRQPLGERESYFFSFEPSYQQISWDRGEIAKNLSTSKPEGRVRDLVQSWVSQNPSLQQKIDLIREFFMTKSFAYTLSPPAIQNLEEFLFETKVGYCEHFAGATASLLRWLRVPARVVAGYQGGTSSLMGDYLIVNQQDAHAWIEYFDADKRSWVRLDPTSWVAEERILLGGQEYFSRQKDSSLMSAGADWVSRFLGSRAERYLTRGRLIIDQAEIWWVTMLVRFDFRYQQEIFKKLGVENVSRLALFFVSVMGLIFVAFSVAVWWRRRLRWRVDPAQTAYRDLLKRLERSGFQVSQVEGPLAAAERAMVQFPQAQDDIGDLFSALIAARYGGSDFGPREEAEVRRKLRTLKLEKPADSAA